MAAPIEIIDDDDEFDWEAAVQEIDIACQTMGVSSSASVPPPQPAKWEGTNTNHGHPQTSRLPSKNHRQSTLDKFVTGESNRDQGYRLVADRDKVEVALVEAGGGDDRACYVDIDPEAAKTWIYPENVPLRKYQLSITEKALFSNTLVALPTGLGKTLIAAVVMYNYFRWFPEGKIVFAAPSRPLVTQQIEACHNTVGIPQEWTIDLTGQTAPTKRACLWKDKRVFFVTPQVLEKDIQSGACPVRYLVCLVIDEAHRASGNYSYCVAVRELMAVPVQLRILALSATPGSNPQTIQQVIDNLQISTLEYRSESDADVTPYVHDRKMELIQVPLGEKAVEINNLISDVISMFVARLPPGVLFCRDVQTLIPCQVLTSRERFRQAPPPSLPHARYGEIEGVLGVLLSLCHLRKLLLGHGIRPASEMVEELLTQGNFIRMINKNERFHRARLLMQRSLTHGAPSPKLAKLTEVLVDHFRNNDPDKSRIIIFSNYRGSVSNIMDTLSTMGSLIKATEFVGQTSGKMLKGGRKLKGQSQKVQQAVLEKFRRGGYNVIVATSIGEEGLDIMEVDLVICFDANISPLRMIQRMGRTGRKRDGRVVVLACEGPEMKGYNQKLSISKRVTKHMHNGGHNRFNFHPSPRMVSHIFKPEQLLSRLSIPEFVPRGKRVINDETAQTETPIEKLTDTEAVTLAKYFHNNEEVAWKPSLIAFPHCQGFPTRVNRVKHSSRTGMLIDMMQHLRGIWPPDDFDKILVEPVSSPSGAAESSKNVEDIEGQNLCGGLNMIGPDSPGRTTSPIASASCAPWLNEELDGHPTSLCRSHTINPSPTGTENPGLQHLPVISHEHLFGSEVVTVGPHGKVFISPIPVLAFKDILYSTSRKENNSKFILNCSKLAVHNAEASRGNNGIHLQSIVCVDIDHSVDINCKDNELPEDNGSERRDMQSPAHCEESYKDESMCLETPPDALAAYSSPAITAARLNGDMEGGDFSPRLTNFITSGVVPESPLPCNSGEPNVAIAEGKENVATDNMGMRNNWESPVGTAKCLGVEQVESSPVNLTNSNCSKEWYMSSGKSSEQPRQLKRLRKIGERGPQRSVKKYSACSINLANKFNYPVCKPVDPGGKERRTIDIRDLIEIEAEVSAGGPVSDDEEVGDDVDSYDDSFIDDRPDPTSANTQATATANTQAEGSGAVDMMAIYRRSLLSQSPFTRQKQFSTLHSPTSVSRTTYSPSTGSCKENGTSLKTPEAGSNLADFSNGKNSVCSRVNLERIAEDSLPSTSGRSHQLISDPMSRKRKFGSRETVALVCATNLDKEFSVIGETSAIDGRESSQLCQENKNSHCSVLSLDDEFYDSLDFDELEAHAAKLLRQKTDSSKPTVANILASPPSFDLGI